VKLEKYLLKEKISMSQFARQVNLPKCTIWQLIKGDRYRGCNLSTAYRIIYGTNGKVTIKDLLHPFDLDMIIEEVEVYL